MYCVRDVYSGVRQSFSSAAEASSGGVVQRSFSARPVGDGGGMCTAMFVVSVRQTMSWLQLPATSDPPPSVHAAARQHCRHWRRTSSRLRRRHRLLSTTAWLSLTSSHIANQIKSNKTLLKVDKQHNKSKHAKTRLVHDYGNSL